VTVAHGLVAREDLPIPEWLFGWAAAVVLVVSFLALAALWREPKLDGRHERPLLRIPPWVDPLCGALGVAAFAGAVYAGFAGSQTPTSNVLPTAVYVLFWVGLVPVSVLFGEVFRAYNPWRAVGRAVAFGARRLVRGAVPEPLPYPERLGRWPAVVGLLAFGWVELVATDGDDPSTLAALALAYAVAQFVGMALYGVEAWTARGDAFGVYFGMFAGLSPLAVRDGRLVARRPLSGLAGVARMPGTVAFLCAAIGITAFDGASEGELWTSIAPDIQRFFGDLGAGAQLSLELAFTVGLLMAVLLVVAVYRLGVLGMRSVERGHTIRELATRFAPSLVPIALAYVVAHYFSLALFQGQATAYLISDPLGEGSDIFGTAGKGIDYGVLSANAIWYVQVGALVTGHVAGLTLAHDRALSVFRSLREATRSQYWMLAVMVAFTTLGLWLLSLESGNGA
jgi:hypothetical protein